MTAAPWVSSRSHAPTASPWATTCCTASAGARSPWSTAQRARVVDVDAAPASAYLGVLGMTGLTAYAGLTRIADLKRGRRRLRLRRGRRGRQRRRPDRQGAGRQPGHRQRRLGREGAPPRRRPRLRRRLQLQGRPGRPSSCARRAPDGIDVYFDNVGGDHLEAAIGSLRLGGRIAVCGMISVYNDTEPAPGPRNLARLIQTRGRIEGFLVGDHYDLAGEYAARAAEWLADGPLTSRETFGRRDRERGRRLPRRPARRQHREDGRPPLSVAALASRSSRMRRLSNRRQSAHTRRCRHAPRA